VLEYRRQDGRRHLTGKQVAATKTKRDLVLESRRQDPGQAAKHV
jgi:hypothetical protein